MAMVSGRCPRCNTDIQLDNQSKIGFCMHCGGKIAVAEAVSRYAKAHENDAAEAASMLEAHLVVENLQNAQALLTQQNYEAAERIYSDIVGKDVKNWPALWGLILARTRNLTPAVLKSPDDFAYGLAVDLFERGGMEIDSEWREAYWGAFAEACRMTVDSVDPRVFLELEIYRWYPHTNTFLYPISKDFDIQPILDKVLWEDWSVLLNSLPVDRRDLFQEQCDACCRKIREYFVSGFSNLAELRNGDLSRLMGTWHLKLSTGAIRTDVLHFTQNAAGVPHLEAFRTSINGYDYYRYLGVDGTNRITAGEHRHFPSTSGIGGDFFSYDTPEPVMGIMAVYEYVLIMPTALYSRIDMQKINGIERANAYMQKCKTMPCFKRSSLRNAYQMRPIADNAETSEPTKKMRSCYIATAVYGDIDAPEVCRLRQFRDERLNTSRTGRRLCSLYYTIGPWLAERIKPGGAVSRFSRHVLDAFVKRLR